MGPRSCERGNFTRSRPCSMWTMLQWGRARASAEITTGTVSVQASSPLQWGRARASAEMHARNINMIVIYWLQWGRARASAEISHRRERRPGRDGFNGAALVRARKWRFGGYEINAFVWASMGPRSCERGNRAACRAWQAGRFKLQWGRARASAEMNNTNDGAPFNSLLQWGRARASAEMGTRRRTRLRVGSASMGPRSCERGNSETHPVRHVEPSCFNGAALVRARKSPYSASREAAADSLQWGRARASAEISARPSAKSKKPYLLQWGRARASAEIRMSRPSSSLRPLRLQWGRARASAEMRLRTSGATWRTRGFNGAALVRARKSAWQRRRGRDDTRGFNGAALVRARK